MSDTKVDMPKFCQMLDAGWRVRIRKDAMGSYTAEAVHPNASHQHNAEARLIKKIVHDWKEINGTVLDPNTAEMFAKMEAADFTPEQALTRLAYKVHGEII